MAKKIVGVRRGGVTTMFTGTPDTASLNMLIDKKPAGSTASVGAYIGATRSGDVSAFDALGSGPLALDVNGVETATAPLSAMLAGTTALTVPDTIDAIMKLRWGSGTNAVYSNPATIVAAPAYAPNIVLADYKAVTKYVDSGTAQNALVSVTSFNAPDFSDLIIYGGSIGQLRVDSTGQVVCRTGYGRNDGTTGSTNNYSSTGLATVDTWIGVVSVADVAKGTHDLYVKVGTGPLAFISSITMTDVNYIGFKGEELKIGYRNTATKFSGVGFWETGGLPAGFDPVASQDTFFMSDGRINNPTAINELLGAPPTEAKFGNAASWTNLENEGTAGPFTGVDGGGVFTDVAYAPPASGGGTVEPTAFASTSDSDIMLTDPNGSYATTLTEADVLAFGDTDSGLDTRLSIVADRASIVLGELIGLKIDGLTDEEAATWGFMWEFGTAGEFQHLGDMPWHMRQKNRATGHIQCCAWSNADMPGTKTVKVHVIPPAWLGIKGTTLKTTVENRDPDVEFPAAETWIVDPTGTGTGAPAGTVVTTYAEAHSGMSVINRGRVLFRRGQTYVLTSSDPRGVISRAYTGGVMFGAWGPATDGKATIDIKQGGFKWTRHEKCPFMLFKDIVHIGGYDVVSGDNTQSNTAWEIGENSYWTWHGCEFRNMRTAVSTLNQNDLINEQVALWDCDVTAWENYGVYVDRSQRVYLRGSSIAQHPDTATLDDAPIGSTNPADSKNIAGPVNHADHGPFRQSVSRNSTVIITQARLRAINGWSAGSQDTNGSGITPRAHQSNIRLFTREVIGGSDALINDLFSEGAGYTIGGGAGNAVLGAGFVAMHGIYHLAGPNYCSWGISQGGAWVRDNIIIVPDVLREDVGLNAGSYTWGGFGVPSPTGGSMDPLWKTKPIRIFNNTIAWMLSPANIIKYGGGPDMARYDELIPSSHTSDSAPDAIISNNLIWTPNSTLEDRIEPIVPNGIHSAGSTGPAPTYRGRHYGPQASTDPAQLVLDTQYATPAGAVILPALEGASTLDGTADTALCGALDALGRIRTATPAPGALPPKVLRPA